MVSLFVAAMFCHLQTKDGHVAEGTMEAEIADLLYLTIERWRKLVPEEEPCLILDNVNIQAGIPDRHIHSRYGSIDLPAGNRIRIPPHSPDCNQVAEHAVGACKNGIIHEAFKEFTQGKPVDAHTMRRVTKRVMKRFAQGKLYADGVRHNVRSMPKFWWELSSATNASFVDEHGRTHWGSAGDWVSARQR